MKKKQETRTERKKPAFLRKKVLIPVLSFLLLVGCATAAGLAFGKKEPDAVPFSASLQFFANGTYTAASAPAGEAIGFSAEWFDRATGSTVSAVTLTALPPVTEGTLKLGHGEAVLGQTIPRETLSYLSFTPTDGVKKSSFSFIPSTKDGTAGFALTCHLSVTEGKNCCPVEKGAVMAVSTHESLSLTGTLSAQDPEGDALYFEICSYPKNGTVNIDMKTGKFVYTPDAEFDGKDSFTWRVQDGHGNYSGICTVNVTVRPLATGWLFTDIEDNAIQSAALRVCEAGVLSGEETGGKHYFHPEGKLTRAAFVAMLLDAAEIKAPDAEDTGFADDAEIPRGMKGAVRYAKERGWLGEDDTFRPGDAVTRAEAAAIAAKVLGLSAPGYAETVRDFSEIPVGVADAIYALFEGGYITTIADGNLAPAENLTRGDAARFFARILDGNEN